MPKISFGIIVLNGQPFLEYNLRALYPFAHEIIVVEGAVRAASSLATSDGHSVDGTLQMLADFKRNYDPGDKLRIVTAGDEGYRDGFWPEKDEMSQAYATRVTGDWLWQVDSDEFYHEKDMEALTRQLDQSPEVTAVSFPYLEFFGSFNSVITGQWHLYQHSLFHRLFRWEKGYKYKSHRPPTVVDEHGVDLRRKHWISSPRNANNSINLFHYSYVFPKQAEQKVGYYSNVDWTPAFRENKKWFDESYLGLKWPMFLGEKGWPILQWLERYQGEHPEAIVALQGDLASGKMQESIRPAGDIDTLLGSPLYKMEKTTARLFLAWYWPLRGAWKKIRRYLLARSR